MADSDPVPLFIPSLLNLLRFAEQKKGGPLTRDEVIAIRDKAPCVMISREDAAAMELSRGRDISPDRCWEDWQVVRKELAKDD